MKKVVSLFLAAVLCAALVGCSGNGEAVSSDPLADALGGVASSMKEFQDGVASAKSIFDNKIYPAGGTITEAQYNSIEEGMEYSAVMELLGCKNDPDFPLKGYETLTWEADTSFVTLSFMDGKLSTKYSFGLGEDDNTGNKSSDYSEKMASFKNFMESGGAVASPEDKITLTSDGDVKLKDGKASFNYKTDDNILIVFYFDVKTNELESVSASTDTHSDQFPVVMLRMLYLDDFKFSDSQMNKIATAYSNHTLPTTVNGYTIESSILSTLEIFRIHKS